MDNKYIGGFFELEITRGSITYHKNAYALNNGRSCFLVMLQNTKPSLVYVPFYCCDTLLEPLKVLNIPFIFYRIDEELQPLIYPDLQKDELFLYINYFGLKKNICHVLADKYKQQVIIDNTQAFFEKEIYGAWAFNSARKYVGVPDGAYLYAPYEIEFSFERNKEIKADHLIQRLLGNQQQAFNFFIESEAAQYCKPSYISVLSEQLLSNINYNEIERRRKRNFMLFEAAFGAENKLQPKLIGNQTPFCYPLFTAKEIDRKKLYVNNLFIPILWKEVNERNGLNFDLEKELSKKLLPLPVDHRLSENDIQRVIFQIKKMLNDGGD